MLSPTLYYIGLDPKKGCKTAQPACYKSNQTGPKVNGMGLYHHTQSTKSTLTGPKHALGETQKNNHSTQDSRVVPHRGTDWAALWLTAQIGRDAVLSESYGRGCKTMPSPP